MGEKNDKKLLFVNECTRSQGLLFIYFNIGYYSGCHVASKSHSFMKYILWIQLVRISESSVIMKPRPHFEVIIILEKFVQLNFLIINREFGEFWQDRTVGLNLFLKIF